MSNLSNIPSELLTQAVDHLELLEHNPLYKIDMGAWHRVYPDKLCHVCLAGAWLAGEIAISPQETATPYTHYKNKEYSGIYEAMIALDEFRSGFMHNGLTELDLYEQKDLVDRYIKTIEYKDDPALFKEQMRDMAATFKKVGI